MVVIPAARPRMAKLLVLFFGITQEELRGKIRDSFPLPDELRVEDVASLVVFLVSDGAKMMTGQAINITGGLEVH